MKLKHNLNNSLFQLRLETLQESFFSFFSLTLSKLQVSAALSFFTTEIPRTELRLDISSLNMASLSLFLPDQMTALKIMISESVNTAMKAAVESIQSVIDETISNMQFQKSSQLLSAQNVQTS